MRRLLLALFVALVAPAAQAAGGLSQDPVAPAVPDAALAATLLAISGPLQVRREAAGVPGWAVLQNGKVAGWIGSTWEITQSVGYSGRPLDVLVAITPAGRMAGAKLMQHNEPVLTLGISEADIAAYVARFAGRDLAAPPEAALAGTPGIPDVIARATVSTGVIRDGILRTARTLAIARGAIVAGSGIDRLGFAPRSFAALEAEGALVRLTVSMTAAAEALAGAKVPVPRGEAPFLDLRAGLIDPPTVGQNLLGQQGFTRAVGSLGAGETVLLVMSAGLHSHRGTEWQKSGFYERIAVVQDGRRHLPAAADFTLVKGLAAEDAPEAREISLFRLPGEIDPLRPFAIEIRAARPAVGGGEVSAVWAVDYRLPDAFRTAAPPAPEPLWRAMWREKLPEAAAVSAWLGLLTLILFAQDWIVRRPKLWQRGRLLFLAVTFLGLGWGLNGQLSVVQVVAFIHSLLNGFRWETFLIEPVIFLLWSFTALGLLFWGRGVYCGWLCPFGAAQELANAAARQFGVRQVVLPQAVHERLWVIKYSLFVGILALSFYSMRDALLMAEVEPFKTAISLRMVRAWPFVLFVLAILAGGLFIERFYCRYLCPLGAGLAIPAKLKIFDWLHRRPQCGRECRLCETKCTVGAIDAVGRINPNECVLCLRCQVIMNDAATCPVLKRRARTAEGSAA